MRGVQTPQITYLILNCASGDSNSANVRAMQQADLGVAVTLFVRGVIALCLGILILQTAAAVWSRTVLAMALGPGALTAPSVAGANDVAGSATESAWSTSFFATAPADSDTIGSGAESEAP